ncbi:hypothetical protein GCM10028791_11580 [Echinicola sediminis]
MKSDSISESARLLQKDFELSIPGELNSKEELIKLLEPIIKQLLDRDLEKLLHVCYRIDLGEHKLKNILHTSAPERMAYDLSAALVDRQIQKIEIRRKYQ